MSRKSHNLHGGVPWAIPEGKTIVVLRSTFIAEVIRWGIRQNPFQGRLPRDATAVISKLNRILPDFIEKDNMLAYVSETIGQVSEIQDWNLSQVEHEKGIKVDDPDRPPFSFSSRYGGPKSEHDFIDLDALAQNIATSLVREHLE